MGNMRNNNIFCTNCKGQGHPSTNCPSPNNMRVVCLNCGKEGHSIEDCWHLVGNRQNGPNMMIPNTQYEVNQIQGGPRSGWNGQRQNGNWNQQRNPDNVRNGGLPQNSYQGVLEYNQNNQNLNMGLANPRRSFTQATWNKPSRYIPPEYVSYPNLGKTTLSQMMCFRCQEFGHLARNCKNDCYEEDSSPLCGNCKQEGHLS